MRFNKIFILILLVFVLFSINIISASDLNNSDDVGLSIQELDFPDSNMGISLDSNDLSYSEEGIISDNNLVEQQPIEEVESHVIYVGQNKTVDGGNGSLENPFSTLNLACSNVNGEKKNNNKYI